MRFNPGAVHHYHASIQVAAVHGDQNIQGKDNDSDDSECNGDRIGEFVIPDFLTIGEYHAHLDKVVHDGSEHEPVPDEHDWLCGHEDPEAWENEPG